MPVLAQFDPQGRPGETVDAGISGINTAQSWMDRAQERQMRQEQLQQLQAARAEYQAKLPAIQAKTAADFVTAKASVALATRMEELRAKAAVEAPNANNEFLDAMQLADPQYQFSELGRIQGKYSWMKNLPEYQPFLDAVDKSRGEAFHLVTANNLADAAMERTRALMEGRQEIATDTNATKKEVAAIGADARLSAADTSAKARVSTAGAGRDAAMQRTEYKSYMGAAAQADANAAKMSIAGNEGNAAIYRKHAQEFRDKAAALLVSTEPVKFNVPGVTDRAAPAAAETQATEPAAPDATPKLYLRPEQEGDVPSFAPSVRTPEDVLKAMQQMVDDGVIDAEQARETLTKLGFKKKGG